jgi:hypothetical protein
LGTVARVRSSTISALLVATALVATGCASESVGDTAPTTLEPQANDADTGAEIAEEQRFPDVLDASAEWVADAWTISAMLSSPYDTPDRYADAWRVVGPDGRVYGERVLAHDHAGEQPFTRSEPGIENPDDITEVVIEGRDLKYGYGGTTFTLILPR